jgi:hypothetical protein
MWAHRRDLPVRTSTRPGAHASMFMAATRVKEVVAVHRSWVYGIQTDGIPHAVPPTAMLASSEKREVVVRVHERHRGWADASAASQNIEPGRRATVLELSLDRKPTTPALPVQGLAPCGRRRPRSKIVPKSCTACPVYRWRLDLLPAKDAGLTPLVQVMDDREPLGAWTCKRRGSAR